MAIRLCLSLASHLSCFKDSALASEFALQPEHLPISLDQTASLCFSCPHPSVFPPEWQSKQHLSIALDRENTQHSPDSIWLTLQILRQRYSYFITAGFLELYTDRFPQDTALRLSYKKDSHLRNERLAACGTCALTGSTVLHFNLFPFHANTSYIDKH